MNAFNPVQFRAQFPALADAGVYLDSAATTLKPLAVIEASDQFYRLSAGNVHRSQFAAARQLTERYENARERVAALLNAPSGEDIVWTRGTTEAINMVAQSYVRPRLKPGDEIIVSEAEHHANLVPWLMVAEQTGARVVKLPLAGNRLPDVAALGACISRRTSRRWISTFMLFPAISSTGRPASARCMANANGWRRCRRGSAGEK